MATGHRTPTGTPATRRNAALTAILANRKVPTLLIADIRSHVVAKAQKPSTRRADVLHPSAMAKSDWCARSAYVQLKANAADKERPSFKMEAIYQYGHDAHARWQKWLAEMGLLAGCWICVNCKARFSHDQGGEPQVVCPRCSSVHAVYDELPMYDADLNILGSTDGFVPSRECLIEIKTIGVGTIRYDYPDLLARHCHETKVGTVIDLERLWDGVHRPFPPHIRQGMIYLHCARKMGLPVKKIAFLYDSKLTQDAKEFVVDYDERPIADLLTGAQTITRALRGDCPPPPCIKAPHSLCAVCKKYEGTP